MVLDVTVQCLASMYNDWTNFYKESEMKFLMPFGMYELLYACNELVTKRKKLEKHHQQSVYDLCKFGVDYLLPLYITFYDKIIQVENDMPLTKPMRLIDCYLTYLQNIRRVILPGIYLKETKEGNSFKAMSVTLASFAAIPHVDKIFSGKSITKYKDEEKPACKINASQAEFEAIGAVPECTEDFTNGIRSSFLRSYFTLFENHFYLKLMTITAEEFVEDLLKERNHIVNNNSGQNTRDNTNNKNIRYGKYYYIAGYALREAINESSDKFNNNKDNNDNGDVIKKNINSALINIFNEVPEEDLYDDNTNDDDDDDDDDDDNNNNNNNNNNNGNDEDGNDIENYLAQLMNIDAEFDYSGYIQEKEKYKGSLIRADLKLFDLIVAFETQVLEVYLSSNVAIRAFGKDFVQSIIYKVRQLPEFAAIGDHITMKLKSSSNTIIKKYYETDENLNKLGGAIAKRFCNCYLNTILFDYIGRLSDDVKIKNRFEWCNRLPHRLKVQVEGAVKDGKAKQKGGKKKKEETTVEAVDDTSNNK